MDLWIRSQDKSTLKCVKDVYCNCNNEILVYRNVIYEDYCDFDLMGKYGTRERALEVLDEIQELILNQSKIYVESSCLSPIKPIDQKYIKELVKGDTPILDERLKIKTTNIDTVVYEMPLE